MLRRLFRRRRFKHAGPSGNATRPLGMESLEVRTVFSTLSGAVFHDVNYDKAFSAGDYGLANVTLTLTGMEGKNKPVRMTTVTDDLGNFTFTGLKKGDYAVAVSRPAGYVPGHEQPGTAGGTATQGVISNITISKNDRSYDGYLFSEILSASLRGYSYVDVDRDANYDQGDRPLGGVTVKLAGVDDRGAAVERQLSTAADGGYRFSDLRPGTYEITANTPNGYIDGRETLGRFDENSHSVPNNGNVYNDRFGQIVLGVGQSGRNYNFGEYEQTAAQGTLATTFTEDVVFDGTSADDLFEFIAGTDNHTVRLNGQAYTISASTNKRILFYGRGGQNVAQLVGGAGVDQAELRESSAKLTGVSYQVLVYTTRTTTVQSGGGEDRALFYDSPGNDAFFADPRSGSLSGDNYRHTANDFHRIYAYASLGNDTATLTGSASNDQYTATPLDARMTGSGYYNYVKSFDVVRGQAGEGDDDRAYLYDSAGSDNYVATGNESRLYGASFDNYASGFDRAYAYASDGVDLATFNDTADSDYFRVDDDGARMYTSRYYNRAIGFELHNVVFSPADGRTDKVAIYDSIGNDLLIARGNKLTAYRNFQTFSIVNPDVVEAHGDLGNDRYLSSGISFILNLVGDWNPYLVAISVTAGGSAATT